MDPTLKHGDMILVRKCDFKFWGIDVGFNSKESGENDTWLDRAESRNGSPPQDKSSQMSIRHPPRLLPGSVAVFKSPSHFPIQVQVKRVIGQEEQHVRPRNSLRHVEVVPPNHLWVEGDNSNQSHDSCNFGPLNKQLVLGKAEYIIWPPGRIGRIESKENHLQERRAWW